MPPRRIKKCFVIFMLASSFGILLPRWSFGQRLNPPYLSEMPTVDRVLADTKGDDQLDTLARQDAALAQLQKVVQDMGVARNVSGYLPDETRIIGNYWDGITRVQQQAKAITGPPDGANSAWAKWMAQEGRYERDPDFRSETLHRYLSPEFHQHLSARNADTDEKVDESNRRVLRGLRNGKESPWQDMSRAEQVGAIQFGILVLIILALQMVREFRFFGIDPKNPSKLRAGFRTYTVYRFTGVVKNYYRSKGSQVTNTTYVNTQTNERNTVTNTAKWEEEAFDLVNATGKHFVHVIDAKVDIANDRVVTAYWGIRGKKPTGDYFLFIDHTTDRFRPHAMILPKILAPRKWLIVPLALLGFLIGSSTGIFLSWLPLTNAMLKGFVGMWIAGVAAFVGIVFFSHKRKRAMVKRDRALLLKTLEEEGDLKPENLVAAPVSPQPHVGR